MKPIITIQGRVDSRRECLPLRDMTDCLLQAYDCVARRAYQKFLRRGGVPGGELDDRLNAEHELLGNLPVDVEDAGVFVSALASLPGLTSEDVDVGIDPRWLVILGRHNSTEVAGLDDQRVDDEQIAEWASAIHTDARILRFRARRATGSAARKARANESELNSGEVSTTASRGEDNGGKKSTLQAPARDGDAEKLMSAAGGVNGETECLVETESRFQDSAAPSQLFCILELPTEVEPSQCVAVLANGLLGIRMPKKTA